MSERGRIKTHVEEQPDRLRPLNPLYLPEHLPRLLRSLERHAPCGAIDEHWLELPRRGHLVSATDQHCALVWGMRHSFGIVLDHGCHARSMTLSKHCYPVKPSIFVLLAALGGQGGVSLGVAGMFSFWCGVEAAAICPHAIC